MIWLDASAGLLIGMMIGLTGVGGGALMTPLLVLVFGMAPEAAIGTDLLYAALTKLVGAWIHARRDSVDWLVLRRLSAGSIPAALATLVVMKKFGGGGVGHCALAQALGVTLLLTGAAYAFKTRLLGLRSGGASSVYLQRTQSALTTLVGALIGCMVTVTSVGAGALGAVALTYLYPRRLTPARLVGTDLAHAIPLAMFAGLGHASAGDVDFELLGSLLLGSVPGIAIGSMVGLRLRGDYLRIIVAFVLLLSGAKLTLTCHAF